MAKDGHAPTKGPGNRLHLLGQRICPDCREDLYPGGDSSFVCLSCDASFPVGGGAP